MTTLEILLVAIGLSMDAFAVALCKCIKMRPFKIQQALIIALFFNKS
jgi:putative Mn2+ efflux pump MntP